jgi:hypothetical protein
MFPQTWSRFVGVVTGSHIRRELGVQMRPISRVTLSLVESRDLGDSRGQAEQELRQMPAEELVRNRADLQRNAQAAGLSPDEIAEILNSRPELPRPLLPEEQATLNAILATVTSTGETPWSPKRTRRG